MLADQRSVFFLFSRGVGRPDLFVAGSRLHAGAPATYWPSNQLDFMLNLGEKIRYHA
jgi:hypothetical protein